MQVKSFLFTLGAGMVAGGTVALMLPQQSQARKTAQKAADRLEQTVSDAAERVSDAAERFMQ